MQLKLISTGGFTGKDKSADVDLSQLPEETQQALQQFLEQQTTAPPDQSRDQEKYYWVVDDKHKKIDISQLDHPALNKLFNEMKEKLSYDK